jgi:hypothetical protein
MPLGTGFWEGGWEGECGDGICAFSPMNQRTIHGWGTLLMGCDTVEQKQQQVPFGFGQDWIWVQPEWEEGPCSSVNCDGVQWQPTLSARTKTRRGRGAQSEIAKKSEGGRFSGRPYRAAWHVGMLSRGFTPGYSPTLPTGGFPRIESVAFLMKGPGLKPTCFAGAGFRGLKAPAPSVFVYGPEGSYSLRWKLSQNWMHADLTPARKG